MAEARLDELTEFRIGLILRRTFVVFRNMAGRFYALSLVACLPWLAAMPTSSHSPMRLLASITVFVFGLYASLLLQAPLMHSVSQALRGQPVRPVDSVLMCLRHSWPLFGVALAASLLVLIRSIQLFVPGLIAIAFSVAALPACIMENLGVAASLKRSSDLSRGYRGQILAVFVLVQAAALVSCRLCMLVFAGLSWPWVAHLATGSLAAVGASLTAILAAVIYHGLCVIKEGTGLEHVASVFD